ncbi:MAG: hypothetical protein HQL94_11150 [Magnetococcales bacterium]|nr:hypothetical protein [Magnetococcales bacterium]
MTFDNIVMFGVAIALFVGFMAYRDDRRIKNSQLGATQTKTKNDGEKIYSDWKEAANGPFIAADLETTGFKPPDCKPIEFSAVLVDANGNIAETFSVLVNHNIPIPRVITGITGLTRKQLELDGIGYRQAFQGFVSFLRGYPVFFHNAPFDVRFLNSSEQELGIKINNKIFDTLPIARDVFPNLPNHKLPTIADHLGVTGNFHRGLQDSVVVAKLVVAASRNNESESVHQKNGLSDNKSHGISVEDLTKDKSNNNFVSSSVSRRGYIDGKLRGQKVVFTGILSMPRSQAADAAAKAGCDVYVAVSKKITVLVVGGQDLTMQDNNEKSSKQTKAEELISQGYNIKIINESEFLKMIE